MKILGIRFENLNSLTGEWQIDFTHPDYSSNGIFAITGPTGAGKTTILDALCLGLYGRTPRLDKVTQNSNEIMSRQTGECFAEVTFETQKGRYRCHWSQRRARKRPDGELQQAKREIADADSEKVLESKINQVEELIEKVTGMDFDRFTRSMLLAQGGFAAFLQASPDKRSPILEQITGTEIYSRISMKVHERHREEREKLELLQSELKGIQVLTEEEENALQGGLKEKQAQETGLAGKMEGMRAARVWLEKISSLEKDLAELEKQRQDCEQRCEAFEPEAKRLEKARRALGLEGDYTSVATLRRQQEGDVKELDGVTAVLPEKEKACAEALDVRQGAEAGLNAGRSRQTAEADVIRKVRELDALIGEKKKQIAEKKTVIGAGEKQGERYKEALEKTSGDLAQSQADLEAVHAYLAKHAADAALTEKFAAINGTFAAIRGLGAKHIKARQDLEKAAGVKEDADAAYKKVEADHGLFKAVFEKRQTELKQLTDEITSVLQGSDLGFWRKEADVLKERERLLLQAKDIMARIGNTGTALAGLNQSLETLKAVLTALLKEIESVSDRKSRLAREIENMETQVALLGRIRDLEEDRKRLEDGIPCPLCGATDHPYARGNVPELNQAEVTLKKLKSEHGEVSEKLRKLEADRAETGVKIQHTEKEAAEKKASLEADEKECAEALKVLDIEATREDRPAEIGGTLVVVRAKIADANGVLTLAEQKGREEKSAHADLETARQKFEDTDRALRDARYRLEAAGLEHERLIKNCAVFAGEIEAALAAAQKDVDSFGMAKISLTGLDGILNDLRLRKETWQAKQEAKTVHEKKISALKAEIDRNTALLENLDKELAARRQEHAALIGEHAALQASRRERFGDKNTDEEEARLADAVGKAGKAFEKARTAHAQIEKEISVLKEKTETLKANIERRAMELAQSEKRLDERIRKAGFADETDFSVSRLDENEREKLAEREAFLLREKTELDARRKDRAEALSTERGKNLTEQSDGSAEALKKNIEGCDADLKQIRHDIGAMTQSLNENMKQRKKQQDRLNGIEAQKKECARWDDLHELIGSADGKKFRNFAQGLTFDTMTRYANRQLRKMTNRYLLVRDSSQPLELNVIDNYQAGEIRSTKNLSGGESFIVSLALALGLSHMASRNVRVDSLFLDEGFGTLDEDALETALETLAGLHQDGKLIGVISHVSAFKERIATQIQVIPESGGCSRLLGPGCL